MYLQLVVQPPAEADADDHARRPARVEDVQEVRAVLWKERRDERIGHRFESSVRECENEHAAEQEVVSELLRGWAAITRYCGKGYDRRQNVQNERGNHQLAVADLIADHASDDDAEAEAGEAGAADGAELG